MWGYNTNMGQFGGPMTPRMNMGGGPRGFSPWMQGIPNGFTPPNFANNMGEVFGGMPGGQGPNPDPIRTSLPYYYPSGTGSSGGGPMQFNMGSQPGKMPGNPMTNMPQRPFGFGGGGGNQPRPMEIPPQIAQQLFGYQKPVNDIYQESPSKSTRSKGDNGWLNTMLRSNPYMGGMNRGPQSMGMGGGYLNDVYNLMAKSGGNFGLGGQMDTANGGVLPGFMNTANVQPNSRMMGGGGMGMGLGMGMNSPQMSTQQAAELYFRNMFGGGMGSRNNQSNSGNYYNLVNPIELLGLGGMR